MVVSGHDNQKVPCLKKSYLIYIVYTFIEPGKFEISVLGPKVWKHNYLTKENIL